MKLNAAHGGVAWGLVVCAMALAAWGDEVVPQFGEERFVASAQWARAANVELKAEARVVGGEAKLNQLVRWGDVDEGLIKQAGELVVARMPKGRGASEVGLDEIKELLEGAGLNMGTLRFSGASECKIKWSQGPSLIERMEMQRQATRPEEVGIDVLGPAARPTVAGTPTPTAWVPGAAGSESASSTYRTLKDILMADLCERFALPAEAFVVRFAVDQERLVNLSEPFVRFDVENRREKNIGDMNWDVTLHTDAGKQKVVVNARVQVWQKQLVAARPIAYRQIVDEPDVKERKVLVDQLKEGAGLLREQVVGQQASQDIPAGAMLAARMVEAAQVIRSGQLITVSVEFGSVQIKWVGEAREPGAIGQTIRVRKTKNDSREEFNVLVTGAQEGKLIGTAKER